MAFDDPQISESLRIQLSGFLAPGMTHSRQMRAVNPEPEIPFLCVGFVVTPSDREHVVNVREPW